MFLTCCRSITISYLESWRCCQCKKKVQLIQPGREEETSNFKIHRTWTGYLVRDVQIKNKSPVSWSCFPPGPWLTDCPMPIRCTGTSSPSSISHMKEIDSTGGSANYLINYVDIISIKYINNFLEDQVPFIDLPDKCLLPILADDCLCPRLRLWLSALSPLWLRNPHLNRTSLPDQTMSWPGQDHISLTIRFLYFFC